MANLVNLEAVSKSYGPALLLDRVSIGVAAGERIGVVGRNGAGKSTLLRLIMRREEPDAGRVTHTSGLRVGWVAQADDTDPAATVRECIVGDLPEHEWAGDSRARATFDGLFGGITLPGLAAGLDTVVGTCSGGERRRIALARELIRTLDLLVLDEPTNHLDVEGIAWLAGYLAQRQGSLLVVTHDRWFLDAVCTRTWEVEAGDVRSYDGGYAAYVLAKAERARVAAATEARRANLVRKELAWLRRGPPARTSKPRFRIEAANALIADEPPARNPLELASFAAARLGRTVYELEQVDLSAGRKTLLRGVTRAFAPGERVGLIGVNGSGKTSLLRLLGGQLKPNAGRVVRGITVRSAHLSQEVAELDPTERVLACVERVARVVRIGKVDRTASELLERFGFTGERQWAPVGDLSGGERRRLQILRLLMTGANVLLFDEPTNDLDIETLRVLEDTLDSFVGTLVVVSHDRYFLERTTDSVLALLGDGSLRMLPGGVEEYLRLRQEEIPAPATDKSGVAPRPARPPAADARAVRKELLRIERRLDRIAAEEARLHSELAANASDFVAVADLDGRLRALNEERAGLEEDWLSAAEAVE